MKLGGFVPNFNIHASVSDLYIPTIGLQTQYSKIGGRILEIYKCINWEQSHTVSFLVIFVSNFRYHAVLGSFGELILKVQHVIYSTESRKMNILI
jgi:hypothetical protein